MTAHGESPALKCAEGSTFLGFSRVFFNDGLVRQRRRRWLVVSSSAPTEAICNRIVTLLRDQTVLCSKKKMVGKNVIRRQTVASPFTLLLWPLAQSFLFPSFPCVCQRETKLEVHYLRRFPAACLRTSRTCWRASSSCCGRSSIAVPVVGRGAHVLEQPMAFVTCHDGSTLQVNYWSRLKVGHNCNLGCVHACFLLFCLSARHPLSSFACFMFAVVSLLAARFFSSVRCLLVRLLCCAPRCFHPSFIRLSFWSIFPVC